MSNVQIPERLFVELYKFFCLDDFDPRDCDMAYIQQQLQIKWNAIERRAEYTAKIKAAGNNSK